MKGYMVSKRRVLRNIYDSVNIARKSRITYSNNETIKEQRLSWLANVCKMSMEAATPVFFWRQKHPYNNPRENVSCVVGKYQVIKKATHQPFCSPQTIIDNRILESNT